MDTPALDLLDHHSPKYFSAVSLLRIRLFFSDKASFRPRLRGKVNISRKTGSANRFPIASVPFSFKSLGFQILDYPRVYPEDVSRHDRLGPSVYCEHHGPDVGLLEKHACSLVGGLEGREIQCPIVWNTPIIQNSFTKPLNKARAHLLQGCFSDRQCW